MVLIYTRSVIAACAKYLSLYFQNFIELYDLTQDPDQLKNLAYQVSKETISDLSKRLLRLKKCHGKSCRRIHPGNMMK